MKSIKLTKGKETTLEDIDFAKFSKHKWYCDSKGYASRSIIKDGKHTTEQLHRMILKAQKGQEVDHIDRNPLNNCRNNLRFVSHAENMANRKLQKNNVSGYAGVSFLKSHNKWVARLWRNGKGIHLGLFKTKEQAIKARKAKE